MLNLYSLISRPMTSHYGNCCYDSLYNWVGLCSEIDIFTYLLIGGPESVPARENIFLFPDTIILTRETEGQIDRGPPYGINHYRHILPTTFPSPDITFQQYQTQQAPRSLIFLNGPADRTE